MEKWAGDPAKSKHYEADGKQVSCPHCESDLFEQAHAQLNTPVASFFGLDWLNKSALVLKCVKCGKIQWFAADVGNES